MLQNILHLPHAVRVSSRAKYIRFRILAGTGLEVVLPKGCPASGLRKAVLANKDWIHGHAQEIQRAASLRPRTRHLPDCILLSASDRSFAVCYDADPGPQRFVHIQEQDQVTVQADPQTQAEKCCRLLQEWLKDQGRKVLAPWALSLSAKHKLPIARVQIRRQKTRWASMSTSGTLSLNCQLMFLRAELVQHVLLHELCHIRYPNHGPKFQALLSRISDQSVRCEQEIRYMHQVAVPWWARF